MLSRRGMLAAVPLAGLLSRKRKQVGWTNTVVQAGEVIVGSTGGPQVVIQPGANIAVQMVSVSVGTDVASISSLEQVVEYPSGNTSEVLPATTGPVIITYAGGETAAALLTLSPVYSTITKNGSFTLEIATSSASKAGGTIHGFFQFTTPPATVQLFPLFGTNNFNGNLIAYQQFANSDGFFIADPSDTSLFPKAEAWHPMTLQHGWANRGAGFIPAQYKLLSPVTAWIQGDVSGGTITSGTVLATLPLNYANTAHAQSVAVQGALGTTAHSPLDPVIEAEINGDLKLFNLGAGTTSISFNGLISLDG